MGDFEKCPRSLRIKIISMGNASVGKSCIIKRFCEKRFVPKYLATIGIDYGVTKVTVKKREIKVNIFDMAGHPIFCEVRNEFYKNTQGALLVYDVGDRASFYALDGWLTEMRQAGCDSVRLVVCANKTDTKRCVEESEGRLWADSRGYPYFETSAQNGEGINEMFQTLFEGVIETLDSGGIYKPPSVKLAYTIEQVEAIRRLKNSKDNYERLGVQPGATTDDINKAYKRLAVLLHPDKNEAPGSEEAFKLLLATRTALVKHCR